jgi:uncharacterized protein YgbK (DUF1537 family)
MSNGGGLPSGLLLAFYGDDFTGSTSVLEGMTFAGLPAVMFVEPPDAEQLRRFAEYRAIGIAGIARSQPPAWMDAHLPAAFEALAALNAPITHYKICSTLDSSPTVGSIGRAVDIAASVFLGGTRADWIPLVVAAPVNGRYQAFGNLFAAHGQDIYRLDRHPVMQRHPITPIQESDVRRHIAQQTGRAIGLVDYVAMKTGAGADRLEAELRAGRSLIALDVADEETLRWVGEAIWTRRSGGLFVVGSHGVQQALVSYWRASGQLPAALAFVPAGEQSQIVAVSGSISSITALQIEWAAAHGFDVIVIDATTALDERAWALEIETAAEKARGSLSCGGSPLIVSARGPNDPNVERVRAALSLSKLDPSGLNARIGAGLGALLRRLVMEGGVNRCAISGGDTSGFAMHALGVYALKAVAPIAPGAPLCRAFSREPKIDGIEIALKGGQIGEASFFGSVRAGRALASDDA